MKQLNCVISFFQLHLTLHAYVRRFDMTGTAQIFLRTKQCIILSLPFTCFPPRLPRTLASSISNFEFRKRGGHSSIYRKRGRRRPNGRKRDAFPIGCCGSVRRKLPEPSRNSRPGPLRHCSADRMNSIGLVE